MPPIGATFRYMGQTMNGCYDQIYRTSPNHIMWGDGPGRLVGRIREFVASGTVLDAGCGDGKNALFLEKAGFDVVGYDLSVHALEGLNVRFENAGWGPKGSYLNCNISAVLSRPPASFDAIVSYGLFHCLDPIDRIEMHRDLWRLLRPGGTILFSCLLEGIELPPTHLTPGVHLAAKDEIVAVFDGFEMLESEQGVIVESHPPLVGEHRHNAIWIVARKGA